MAVLYEQIGAELSTIKSDAWQCDWNQTLHYCRTELISNDEPYVPTPDDDLLYDVLLKLLLRGERPFLSHFTEQWIVALYGRCFALQEREKTGKGRKSNITYSHDQRLPELYKSFADVLSPWAGEPEQIAFDPQHPENERELFRRLVDRFGPRIVHCITPQTDVSMLLPTNQASAFMGQRIDFLLSFPNGKKLLIEPGDHDAPEQIVRDRQRDEAFQQLHIETLRPRNADIRNPALYEEIARHLEDCNVTRFLEQSVNIETDEQHAANHLFLLPTLVVRVERLLAHFFLRQGLIHRAEIRIGIIEQDLECAELAVASFLDQLLRLIRLYGIELAIPKIQLYVRRNTSPQQPPLEQLEMPVQVCESLEGLPLDVLLDVGVKCNVLTAPASVGAPHVGSVRQVFPHNRPARFGYRAQTRPIILNDETEALEVLDSFVQDFFRKHDLLPEQFHILRNILSQKATIGLLPTGAGKSLCYQLASLLTPGTTIVVDPIVALMQDQVQNLVEQFGIGRVLAWHAGARLHDQNVAALLSEHLMVFISPERLQRPQFRAAMSALNAADIFINYAVIDEAHCVSMWGHDFRPSYLTLERNFRNYCTFQGRPPVLVALTGTASQLVLIDLKRELNIEDMRAVIRPKTFDREELNFNLIRCPSHNKSEVLNLVMVSIAERLNVQDLAMDAHGIIFSYTPNELWNLFGQQVEDANTHVRTVLNATHDRDIRYGIYTGRAPSASNLNHEQWEEYKSKTLAAFKRGAINMLFGNTAVSVGIDNKRLNYVINYKMPQSMEAYYQQCGRAGRTGQRSECYLIFSDNDPVTTQKWLNQEIQKMPGRRDDLGTIAFFQESNFPGKNTDIEGALRVFRRLFGEADNHGLIDVPEYLDSTMKSAVAERTERYISFWLILGVLTDYEVTGMGRNTVYRVRRHQLVERFLQDHNEEALTAHIVDSLHRHLSRYRPTLRTEVEIALATRTEPNLSARCISYLVDFIYREIEYQRREAIRTMVAFCNEEDTSPDRLRARIRAYFDTSKKFSEGLLAMAETSPDFAAVADLLDKMEGFDDAEHLYWETRRLLDERFRPDWAAANLFAIAYRERASCSDTFMRLFDDMLMDLTELPYTQKEIASQFLGMFLTYLCRLDQIFGEPLSGSLLRLIMGHLYKQHELAYVGLIDEMNVVDEVREQMRLQVVNLQLKEIANAQYSRSIR